MGAGLLRVATAGSVDDGKSTLIGRLLHDTGLLATDTIAALERASAARGGAGDLDLALVTDGLRAEREQGITIDVAYRYVATPRRSFVLADNPGHVQYTRNAVTGASTADVAVVLVDVRYGVVEQTRRHVTVAGLLRVPHLVFCLNKVDLVGFDPAVVLAVETEALALAARAGIPDAIAIPVCALDGDNVVVSSPRTPWYGGPSLLEYLETVEPVPPGADRPARFAVQHVLRVPDYRAYAGRLSSGVLRPGDELIALPSGQRTALARIDTPDGPVAEAVAGMSVALVLADDLDAGRGELLAAAADPPALSTELAVTVCWLAEEPLRPGARLLVRHTSREVRAKVAGLGDRLDVATGDWSPAGKLELNDLGAVTVRTAAPLAYDPYALDRTTGSLLLLDEQTGATLGAGMLR